jgi:CBS domain-containing protein
MLGTVSEGDIRRGLMRRLTMDAPVRDVMNTAPVAFRADGSDADALRRLSDRGMTLAPCWIATTASSAFIAMRSEA